MHAIMKHGFRARVCFLRKKDFQTKQVMVAQQLAAHRITYGEPKQFVCEEEGCWKSFATRRGRDQHRALVHKIYFSRRGILHRCTEKFCWNTLKTVGGLMNYIVTNP